MTLDKAKTGAEVGIVSIPDRPERLQLVRMGIVEGARVTCRCSIPAGPVILQHGRQEVAIGRKLAESILIGE